MNDEKIIDLYLRRSEAAIGETSLKYGSYCFAIANNILGNAEDAEECVNDTWFKAWSSIPPHEPKQLSAYLGKITRELAFDRWRKAGAEKRGAGQAELTLSELAECIPSTQGLERNVEIRELTEGIQGFLNTVKPVYRDLFICRYWYCDSIAELSTQFGFSQGKVKTLLHRMRKKLLVYLKEAGIYDNP